MAQPQTPAEIVGRSLKLERIAAGVQLTALAARLAISPGHLSHIESGKRKADSDLIAAYRAGVRELA